MNRDSSFGCDMNTYLCKKAKGSGFTQYHFTWISHQQITAMIVCVLVENRLEIETFETVLGELRERWENRGDLIWNEFWFLFKYIRN